MCTCSACRLLSHISCFFSGSSLATLLRGQNLLREQQSSLDLTQDDASQLPGPQLWMYFLTFHACGFHAWRVAFIGAHACGIHQGFTHGGLHAWGFTHQGSGMRVMRVSRMEGCMGVHASGFMHEGFTHGGLHASGFTHEDSCMRVSRMEGCMHGVSRMRVHA